MPCLFAVFAFYAYGNPYAVWRKTLLTIRSLYWLASHVPDSNVSRPRFERLLSQVRTSHVPDSVVSRPAFADKYRVCLFSSYCFFKTIAFFELSPHIEVH